MLVHVKEREHIVVAVAAEAENDYTNHACRMVCY
jgi:hypothetical protein